MRVEQQNVSVVDLIQQSVNAGETGAAVSGGQKIAAEGSRESGAVSVNMKDVTYLKPGSEEKKTAAEEMEDSSAMDATDRKNQMVVLSNTTSEEDYAKMQEDGFSLDTATANTIVTETDKIKAVLAKAGVDISFFGDDLDVAQMEEIVGSPELAVQLVSALKQADLPLTEDNLKESAEAAKMAGMLKEPGDGAIKYLLDNGYEPTIENLYVAEFSGSGSYKAEIQIDTSSFRSQIEAVILQSGLAVNEQTMADSQWLLENDIPLTAENLTKLEALKSLELPAAEEQLAQAIAQSVAEGNRPKDAVLVPGYRLTDQAEHALEVVTEATDEDLQYLIDQDMDLTIQNLETAKAYRMSGKSEESTRSTEESSYTKKGLELLTAKRQLEETRLVMSLQANYSLLKKGMSIDTEPLAELVEELKREENSYYVNLLNSQNVEPTEENVALFKETMEKVADIQYVPAYVLGSREIDVPTVNAVHKSGMELKDTFERANERYETLMTSPRADMGDSIQKAFRNVDDILEDLQLETTEANRRAVRILGYNGLDITEESITQMKAADEEVQRVFRNMTPSVVTNMIKEGINPLDMDFESLNKAAEQIQQASGEDTEKFSEYLWKLEQNQQISEEERKTYIGIYRLIHQVESSDGAAIGALVHQGAELTMKNLLTAVRSERRSGKVDYSVDDSTGGMEYTGYRGTSITDQIEAAYQQNCIKDAADILTPEKMRNVMEQASDWGDMTPEQFKEVLEQASGEETEAESSYLKEQLAMLEESANASTDIYEVLQRYDIPSTVNNILAMQSMMKDRNKMFRQIFGSGVKDADEKVDVSDLEQIKEELIKQFGEAVSEPAEMAEAQEKLGELAENVMKGMIEDENVTSLDIREMRLLSAKLSIGEAFAKKEQYSVPVMVNNGMVNVSLKIVRGVDKKGIVDIMMESEIRGKIAATFQAKEDGISGFIASEKVETRDLLAGEAEHLKEMLGADEAGNMDIHYAHISDLDLNHFSMGMFGEKAESVAGENSSQKDYQVQTTRLYHIAESFIRQIQTALS